ncbi:MAG: hypothetical protein LBF67_05000 [Prevotellaceae bacterium]|jgi:hypothetical protein|nr:hypothetical protein [Prevotellaceae bacterium]
MLEGTTPIETPKHSFKNFDQARKWAKENIVGMYKNSDTGEDIYISNGTIGKCLSQKAVEKSVSIDAHLAALMQLPKLIETAILREIKQDRDNNPQIKEIQRLYGFISYKEQTYPVKITVKVTQNKGNKAYSYEVTEIENPAEWQGFHNDLSGLSDRNTLTLDGNTSTIANPLVEHAHPSKKSFRSDERNQTTNLYIGKDTNNFQTDKKIPTLSA